MPNDQQIETNIVITGAGSEMQGVGRMRDGRACFVPGALPGETVDAVITRAQPRFCEARLLRVTRPSPDRTEPACPHFGLCGGCDCMHMTYAKSLELKREKVRNALLRIGGVEDIRVLPVLPSEKITGYRNKAEFPVAAARAGCFAGGTNCVLDVDACLLQHPALNRALAAVKPHLSRFPLSFIVPRVNRAGEMMLTLCENGHKDLSPLVPPLAAALPELKSLYALSLSARPAHALDGEVKLLYGRETLSDTLSGLAFSVSPKAFFQVNPPQAEALYEAALQMAALTGEERAADVYCGVGTLSLLAARKCRHVTGIEIVKEAVADARDNARKNALTEKTEFIASDAARAFGAPARARDFGTVFLDPPRKGAEPQMIDALLTAKPRKIVYLSCDPATLARDVKRLIAGGYRAEAAQPVDMFPMTHHVETVMALTRGDGRSSRQTKKRVKKYTERAERWKNRY